MKKEQDFLSVDGMLEDDLPKKMRVWPLVEIGIGEYIVKFTAKELTQLITIIVNMHGGAITVAKERGIDELQKDNAYSTAVTTEKLYDNIMNQLRLYREERREVN